MWNSMAVRVLISGTLTAAACGLSTAAHAQPRYSRLEPPQPTANTGKVEVIEFFSYTCPQCYKLEPAIERWLATVPADVEFRRIPAVASERWVPMARLFYTLKAMGQLERLHSKVFNAIHKDRIALEQPAHRDAWLAKMGVDVARYIATENSFSVTSEVNQARTMTRNYRVEGVPRLVIDGRYVTSPEQAGGSDAVFQAVDEAVARARRRTWMKPPG